jgi:hypothetical protein
MLLADMQVEFPTFAIKYKRTSQIQKFIHFFLLVLTLGGQRVYLTRYHTVMFGALWVPDSWDAMNDLDRYVLLRHERVHLRQRARLGDVAMALVYLLMFFPVGLAYGRARIEAYEETLRATAEVYGRGAALALRSSLIERFTGADYGWMWPFPSAINAWFDACMKTIPT